jgi:AcrR family transcriptional regulator
MLLTAGSPSRPKGRPRSFDRDQILDQAMLVFWERGFDCASVADLTCAMGIEPPSLYAAFGDKEGLFMEALKRYVDTVGEARQRALLGAPTALEGTKRMLEFVGAELAGKRRPSGCMLTLSVAGSTGLKPNAREAVSEMRLSVEASLRQRFACAISDGELPADADCSALANFYALVFQGLSLRARDGANRDALQKVAATALMAWPALESSGECR